MKAFLIGAALLAAGCATQAGQQPLTAIHVVYHPERMEYFIENAGRARLIGADDERVFEFDASGEDFARIADLLAPLELEGLGCSAPPEHSSPGYIVFRRGETERRVAMHTACYADGTRPLARNANRAWYAMTEMGRARYRAPPIPDPTIIGVEWLYWGRAFGGWSVRRGGEGRLTEGESTVTFAVPEAAFDRIRELFRPYEGEYFECERVITDLQYGYLTFATREDAYDQRTLFDRGCITGDATDLFQRIDRADAIVRALRDGPAQ